MQKLETINGTLVFVEVPENCPEYHYKEKESMPLVLMVGYISNGLTVFSPRILPNCDNGYDILGEVTKERITFDCSEITPLDEIIPDSKEKFRNLMEVRGIELREGFKFIVLKDK